METLTEKVTNEELYKEMVKNNARGYWINPKFEQIEDPKFEDHFLIILEKFRSIQSTSRTEIYSITMWEKEVVIHCKRSV